MKNKVIFVCFDGLLSDLGSAQIIPYCNLIKNFADLKICSLEKASKVFKNKSLFFKDEAYKFDIYNESKNSASRFFRNFFKLYKLTNSTISEQKPNIVHCRSYVPMMIVCLIKLFRKFDFKIIFDIRGFFFKERLENINKFISIFLNPIFALIEIYLFRNADLVITLTKSSLPRIKKLLSNSKKPIYVIPTVTNLKNNNIFKSQKEYDFVYLGSANRPYRLDESIKLIGNLNKNHKKQYSLLVITRIKISRFQKLAKQYGFKQNIKFIEVEHDQIFSYIAKCKCGLVFLDPGVSRLAQFPTKVGEFLSQSIPICTNKNLPEISNLIKEFNAGKVINNYFSEKSFNDLADLINENKSFSINAFKLWESKLKLDIAFENYQKIYKNF